MIGIIVTGHGNFATGITSSLELIAGPQTNYQAVDFLKNYSQEDLKIALNKAITTLNCEDILIFSDLAGGTPFKTAVEIKFALANKLNIEVIAGTNLPTVIETVMSKNYVNSLTELTNTAINIAKEQVLKYEFIAHQENDDEEGI